VVEGVVFLTGAAVNMCCNTQGAYCHFAGESVEAVSHYTKALDGSHTPLQAVQWQLAMVPFLYTSADGGSRGGGSGGGGMSNSDAAAARAVAITAAVGELGTSDVDQAWGTYGSAVVQYAFFD
jgi:hypothetical protein